MFGRVIVVLLLLWKQDAVSCLRIVEMRVPTHEREGGMALLGCQYDMEGDTLYSLKWYKGSKEFYRFVPKNEPHVYYFATPGVNVDITRSSNTVVALLNLTQESAGPYCCEVSGEAPLFQTINRTKYIDIHLLPKTGPRLIGLQEQYKVDDLVEANCTLPPAYPKAELKWLVNDQSAAPEYVRGPWFRVSADRPEASEIILQLSFRASASDFVNGAIKLKCQATIPPLYQTETESIHNIALPFKDVTDPPNVKVASVGTDDAESVKSTAANLIIISLIYLILV